VLIADCEVERADGERVRADVALDAGRIAAITEGRAGGLGIEHAARERIDARGGALLPALHDHHLHLYALAAARASIACGPPSVTTRDELASALREAQRALPPGAELRGVAYHESVAGALDRAALDALAPNVRVRLQHRSGALWMLSSAALADAGLADGPPRDGWPAGAELDRDGRSTGRFFRLDGWLAARRGRAAARPSLADASRALAGFGVASATDATPDNDRASARALRAAFASGELLQRIRLMGGADLDVATDEVVAAAERDGIALGERKIVLDERAPLDPDALAREIGLAHAAGRCVAIHCVTRVELALALSALAQAGASAGDRIEHASVAPPELVEDIARLRIAVVTQPGFVFERGDAYLRDVEPRDLPWLYRCAGLDAAGVALAGATDAPYGEPDPWAAMRAAVDRRTRAGHSLGEREALSPERALALFTTRPDAPGGAPRRIQVGARADLVLLDRPWSRARDALSPSHVAATFQNGRRIA